MGKEEGGDFVSCRQLTSRDDPPAQTAQTATSLLGAAAQNMKQFLLFRSVLALFLCEIFLP